MIWFYLAARVLLRKFGGNVFHQSQVPGCPKVWVNFVTNAIFCWKLILKSDFTSQNTVRKGVWAAAPASVITVKSLTPVGWLPVGSPANQHTLCHGCHWDWAEAIDGANIAALEHGPLWVLVLDEYWSAFLEHALHGAMRNLAVKAPWGSVEALHCVWLAGVKAQVLKACGNRR